MPAHVRALGFPTDRLPSKTFQGTPMRQRAHLPGRGRARADLEALLETLGKPDMVSKINRTPPPGGREAPRTCATAGWCGCVCDRRAKSANPATPWV